MKKTYDRIWNLAKPYLKKSVKKDLILHTKGVVKAIQLILRDEEGDEDILIPAAILHDVGWSKVPKNLQKSIEKSEWREAQELHLEYSVPIVKKILSSLNYKKDQIQRIIEIIKSHKFQDPREKDKRLLIDADTLADAFKEQFNSDVKSYKITPELMYKIRKKNKFYTKTAKRIFFEELDKRKKEFENK